jgi:prepilin-type N-terminal cleavage/methylation domain-containing protein/prepilin-type processing-associated H-X9-DG protein
MATRYRAAFTLVEMLVVVAIIATLVGLLLPAVLRAREKARVTECAHNQQQIGHAMIMYVEAKNYFPGYANILRLTANPPNVPPKIGSWAPSMLPFIGRVDLWEGGWRDGNQPASSVPIFVCPSDSPTVNCPLSYVVNVGQGQPLPPVDDSSNTSAWTTQTGLFRNFALTGQTKGVRQISMTDLRGAARRPMIAESTCVLGAGGERQWSDWDLSGTAPANLRVTAARLGFLWPGPPLSVPVIRPLAGTDGALLPIHSGVVNVTFCDGSTKSLTETPEDINSPATVNYCGNYDCANLPVAQ